MCILAKEKKSGQTYQKGEAQTLLVTLRFRKNVDGFCVIMDLFSLHFNFKENLRKFCQVSENTNALKKNVSQIKVVISFSEHIVSAPPLKTVFV